jgi:hypothetical protein
MYICFGNIARRIGDAGLLEINGQQCVQWTFPAKIKDAITEQVEEKMGIEVFAPEVLSGWVSVFGPVWWRQSRRALSGQEAPKRNLSQQSFPTRQRVQYSVHARSEDQLP